MKNLTEQRVSSGISEHSEPRNAYQIETSCESRPRHRKVEQSAMTIWMRI